MPAMQWLHQSFRSSAQSQQRTLPTSTSTTSKVQRQIEDYPSGYPRFSALLAAHPSFQICRGFRSLRTRLLLRKQDQLSVLEKQLDDIDKAETRGLYLSSIRRDKNEQRKAILIDIDVALADYDAFLERNARIMGLDNAPARDVNSIQNWVNAKACITRDEAEYLNIRNDLVCAAHSRDETETRFEDWLTRILAQSWKGFRRSSLFNVSRDPTVHIPSPGIWRRITNTIIGLILIALLLVPIAICNSVSETSARMAIVAIASCLFIGILCGLTRARSIEVFAAGATYTTVLVVFVSGVNTSRDD